MSILSRSIMLLSRSLFLYGLTESRMGSTMILMLFAIISILIVIKNPFLSIIPITLITIYYILYSMIKQLLYGALVVAIPSLWMSLSNVLALYIMAKPIDIFNVLTIFIKAEVGALAILFVMHNINIFELTYISQLLSKKLTFTLILLMRVLPHFLKEAYEMIYIHKLKNEKMWKTLAMLFIRSDEITAFFTEGLYLKRNHINPKLLYKKHTLLVQLILIIVNTTSFVFIKHISY